MELCFDHAVPGLHYFDSFVLVQTAAKLSKTLTDATSSGQSDIELALPEKGVVGAMDLRPAALAKAANDVATMQGFNDSLTSWCKTVELLIQVRLLNPSP